MRKVATFWNEETKYSLRYLPTSGLARAFTRSASALFQVNLGSSKLPLTCNTKTSFSSFRAWAAASVGDSTNCTEVPNEPQLVASLSLTTTLSARADPASRARHRLAAVQLKPRMRSPPGGVTPLFDREGPYTPSTARGDGRFGPGAGCYNRIPLSPPV